MVRGYKVWGSFNRETGHGLYMMSEVRAIVSHRIVVLGYMIGKCSASTYWLAIKFLDTSKCGVLINTSNHGGCI